MKDSLSTSQFEIGFDSEDHMTDIKKYVEGKSQQELLEIQRTSVVDGDVYKAVTFEIHRIQQDTNNIQIANLIGEIKKLKEITETNAKSSERSAKSSNKLSILASLIAIGSLVVAVWSVFLTKQSQDFEKSKTVNLVIAQSISNCFLARQLQNVHIYGDTFFADSATPEWQRFLSNGYMENAPIISDEFGTSSATMIVGAVRSMDVANRLLDYVRQLQQANQQVPPHLSINLSNIGNDTAQVMCKIAGIYDIKFDAPTRLSYPKN